MVMKKVVIFVLLLVVICVTSNASVHANVIFDNGWYSVKNNNSDNCDL